MLTPTNSQEDDKKNELLEALSRVWTIAERKHQDECWYNPCDYCRALSIVAKAYPEMDASRLEYYLKEDENDS